MKRYLLVLVFLLVSACTMDTRNQTIDQPTKNAQTAKFDFYVLTLSWSPDYCASTKNDDIQQCATGKKLGLVLHGLWPQYRQGYPANCSEEKLSETVKAAFPELYPNDTLYDHEWEKHGTCSGLGQESYLALSKNIKESLSIPNNYKSPLHPFNTTLAKLKADFIASNPGLSDDSLAVFCSGSGKFLKELFFCYSLEGKPIVCSEEILEKSSESCGRQEFVVRNVK